VKSLYRYTFRNTLPNNFSDKTDSRFTGDTPANGHPSFLLKAKRRKPPAPPVPAEKQPLVGAS
jgi:hypothetical protein